MRYAIISDIHSNFQALTSALDYIKNNPADKIICCGDIAGYGPSPAECIEELKKLSSFESVMGNHDAAVSGKTGYSDFNNSAKEAVELNMSLAGEEGRAYLSSLKYKISENDLLFVHGSPRQPISEYLFIQEKIEKSMAIMKEKICFVGHTHQPIIYEQEKPGEGHFYHVEKDSEVFELEPELRYLVNVGSVGQPRDQNPRACVAYFDTKTYTLSYKRIEYNVAQTQEKMKSMGFPGQLSARLSLGV